MDTGKKAKREPRCENGRDNGAEMVSAYVANERAKIASHLCGRKNSLELGSHPEKIGTRRFNELSFRKSKNDYK